MSSARFQTLDRSLQKCNEGFLRNGSQAIHPKARQQRIVHLKRGVLGGRADKANGAVLDVRQKGILLALIKAMHLIHEKNGSTAPYSRLPSLINGPPDIFDARKNGRNLQK